jgi:hypothetical protein
MIGQDLHPAAGLCLFDKHKKGFTWDQEREKGPFGKGQDRR